MVPPSQAGHSLGFASNTFLLLNVVISWRQVLWVELEKGLSLPHPIIFLESEGTWVLVLHSNSLLGDG